MTPLWKAYRFTRREQHAAEAARSRESLIQILDRARDEDVSLNPRPSSTILALGLLCLLLGTLGFIITLAGGALLAVADSAGAGRGSLAGFRLARHRAGGRLPATVGAACGGARL